MNRESEFPWLVRYESLFGEDMELRASGDSAQSVVDYVRKMYSPVAIYYVAKIDNHWS